MSDKSKRSVSVQTKWCGIMTFTITDFKDGREFVQFDEAVPPMDENVWLGTIDNFVVRYDPKSPVRQDIEAGIADRFQGTPFEVGDEDPAKEIKFVKVSNIYQVDIKRGTEFEPYEIGETILASTSNEADGQLHQEISRSRCGENVLDIKFNQSSDCEII